MTKSWSFHEPVTAELCSEELDLAAGPGAMLEALAAEPAPAMLDSSAVDARYGRYSVLACRPAETITLRDGAMLDGQGRPVPGETPMDALRAALGAVRSEGDCPVPYGPGWIGYVGYEFGRCLERLPGAAVRDADLPDLHLAFYPATAVYDAITRRWRLRWLDIDGAEEALAALRSVLAGAPADPAEAVRADQAPAAALPKADYQSNFTPEQYERAVARCVEYIAAGDIFQVNLSQRLTVPDAPSPTAIYRALRRRNPAWYSAMLLLGDSAVLSSSPELFLRLRDGQVLTRPIKGTRPRTGEPTADADAAEDLLASAKDNAELAMIIDLLRNDLGRACEFGTVRVPHRRELETHPTVFHLVGSVTGTLRKGLGAADLLAATFPGGSITGAPKIRAMEIIDELETLARGVYTGSVGWFGANGDAELNIAIRTIVHDRGRALIQVGGGIVADSTPHGEYQETLDKARALLETIAAARGPS